MSPKVPVIDLPAAEFRAFSAIEGDQAEQRFEARRAARRRSRAGSDPIHRSACTPTGRSLPSGSAIDWRVTALALVASAVVLPIAVVGYLGLAGAFWGWEYLKEKCNASVA